MLGTRIDGTVVVIECAFSINLTALTLEQVLSKRHKLVKDTISSMVLEMRTRSGDVSADELKSALDAEVLSEEPEYFNNDANFSQAMRKAISLKGEILSSSFVDNFDASEMVFGPQSELSKELDGLIGPPNPDLVKGMHGEHCERTDSHKAFTTSNYNIETTSRASIVKIPVLTAGRAAIHRSRCPTAYSGLQWSQEEFPRRLDSEQRSRQTAL